MSQKDKGAILALVEVSREDCPITNYIKKIGDNAKVEPLRLGETRTMHRIDRCSEPHHVLPKLQRIATNVMRVGKNGFWAEIESCSSCSFFASSNVVVLSSKAVDATRIHYRILIQNQTKLKVLERDLETAGLKPNILEAEYENHSMLTERERRKWSIWPTGMDTLTLKEAYP